MYAVWLVAAPIHATNEATLMIAPPPVASIAGIPYLQPNATPLTFTASTASQIAPSASVIDASSSGMIPALL